MHIFFTSGFIKVSVHFHVVNVLQKLVIVFSYFTVLVIRCLLLLELLHLNLTGKALRYLLINYLLLLRGNSRSLLLNVEGFPSVYFGCQVAVPTKGSLKAVFFNLLKLKYMHNLRVLIAKDLNFSASLFRLYTQVIKSMVKLFRSVDVCRVFLTMSWIGLSNNSGRFHPDSVWMWKWANGTTFALS